MKGGEDLYLRLKFEITRKGYSIEEFAKAINVSEKTLRNKINGATDFTWSECLLIRKTLGTEISLEELFEKEEKAS